MMFHSIVGEFEHPLVNLEQHMTDSWAVRLFLPWRDSATHNSLFEAGRKELMSLGVVKRLQARCVKVEVKKHNLNDLPEKASDSYVTSSGAVLANHFGLSRETYQAMEEEKILFFQQDVALCSRNSRSLESFMEHTYLGAPWQGGRALHKGNGEALPMSYGNGGLSVRSKAFSITCIDKPQYKSDYELSKIGQGLPEDLYFSRCLFEHYEKDVNLTEAQAFSAEEVMLPPYQFLGVHDPCRMADREYGVGCLTPINKQITIDLLESCPEAKWVIARCIQECDIETNVSDAVLGPRV
jgi:hypothetical protein